MLGDATFAHVLRYEAGLDGSPKASQLFLSNLSYANYDKAVYPIDKYSAMASGSEITNPICFSISIQRPTFWPILTPYVKCVTAERDSSRRCWKGTTRYF